MNNIRDYQKDLKGEMAKKFMEILKKHEAKVECIPSSMPLVNKCYSLKPDMRFGWKPRETIIGAPIPLFYNYEKF